MPDMMLCMHVNSWTKRVLYTFSVRDASGMWQPSWKKKKDNTNYLLKLSGLRVKAWMKQAHEGWILSNSKWFWSTALAQHGIRQTILLYCETIAMLFVLKQVHFPEDKCSIGEKKGRGVNWSIITFSMDKPEYKSFSICCCCVTPTHM